MSLCAYPTDKYYDPGRPAWLPYWIDTPTESALKYHLYPGVTQEQVTGAAYPPPKPPPAPAAPQTEEEMKTWTPARAADAYRQLWEQWRPTAIPAPPAGSEETTGNSVLLAIGALGVISLFLVFKRR